MRVLKLWDYQVWDGGSYCNHEAYFYQNTVSEKEVKLLAGTYDAAYDKKIAIYSSIQEYEDDKSGKVRKQALAKLTVAERKALGV